MTLANTFEPVILGSLSLFFEGIDIAICFSIMSSKVLCLFWDFGRNVLLGIVSILARQLWVKRI
jgi:hypothetical protein